MRDWFSVVFYPGVLLLLPSVIYVSWRINLLLFVLVLGFTLPFFAIYPSILMVLISLVYKLIVKFKEDKDGTLRMKFVRAIADMWWIIARVYHGYEIKGLEKIPSGGALIVYYHGMVPIDIGYVSSCFVKFRGQILEGVIDRTMFRIPGIASMAEVMGATCKGREYCTQRLREGNYVSVSPGGSYEMMFGSEYRIEWKGRIGFAKMAKESGKPVIPMFTENIRQYTDMISFGLRETIEHIYEKYRFPVSIAFGGYPVKLRTHFGDALLCGPGESAEEFARRVKRAIEELIREHQTRPGSVFKALAARLA